MASFAQVNELVETQWKVSKPKIFQKTNCVFVFRFESDCDLDSVLSNGLWNAMGSKPLILKRGCTGMPIYPICIDSRTAMGKHISYVRLLIEVTVHEAAATSIEIVNSNGSSCQQKVVFEWLPARCELCEKFGHVAEMCMSNRVSQRQFIPRFKSDQLRSSSRLRRTIQPSSVWVPNSVPSWKSKEILEEEQPHCNMFQKNSDYITVSVFGHSFSQFKAT